METVTNIEEQKGEDKERKVKDRERERQRERERERERVHIFLFIFKSTYCCAQIPFISLQKFYLVGFWNFHSPHPITGLL